MNQVIPKLEPEAALPRAYSQAERLERQSLGLPLFGPAPPGALEGPAPTGRTPVKKRAIRAPAVLNEATEYASAFSRGLRIDLPGGITQLLLSGTASVGPNGETLYPGDFRAQCWRTYHNLTRLLESERATWHDVVRTTCYLPDIERDYDEFNRVRTEFFEALALDPLPASTGIQARLCRNDLLIEMELQAILIEGGGAA
jgi:2-iminobutanoate/2-iminopropanoate deaminase